MELTDRARSRRAVLIAGPTASGKSALALTLAQALGGTIINADSMQVYRDLRIITARPTPEEEARVPHLLYGHVDAAENYSVGRWCVEAGAALAAVERAGRLPVLVGGTGLYFKTLTPGLAAIPPIPSGIRSAVRARLEAEGVAALYAELGERDPATASRLMPGGPRPRHPRARSGAGDRPLAHRLAPGGHEARARPRTARSRSFSMPIARNSTAGSMPASTPCWRRACWTRSRARRPRPRCCAPRDEGARRAVAASPPRRRDRLGGGGRGRQTRHPPLQQAASHLVPQSTAGLDLGRGRTWRRRKSAARLAADAPAFAARSRRRRP